MRIISLSVDGIHQAAQRGLYDWLADQDADIICLQDLRAQEYELDHPTFHPEGYIAYFFDSGEKHSNGVAIYTREQPKALIFGMGFPGGQEMCGRYLQIDFDSLSIGSLLVPNGLSDNTHTDDKLTFLDQMQAHLHKISRKRRDFIFCGNFACAHKPYDLSNPEEGRHLPGYLEAESQWMDQLFNQLEYDDAFRAVNKDKDEYSWWPAGKIGQGDGWRTDYQVVSEPLVSRVEYAVIYKTKQFSSHLPVIIDYDLEVGF